MIELYIINNDNEEFINNFSSIEGIIEWIRDYFTENNLEFTTKVIQVSDDYAKFIYSFNNKNIKEIIFKLQAPDYIIQEWRDGDI